MAARKERPRTTRRPSRTRAAKKRRAPESPPLDRLIAAVAKITPGVDDTIHAVQDAMQAIRQAPPSPAERAILEKVIRRLHDAADDEIDGELQGTLQDIADALQARLNADLPLPPVKSRIQAYRTLELVRPAIAQAMVGTDDDRPPPHLAAQVEAAREAFAYLARDGIDHPDTSAALVEWLTPIAGKHLDGDRGPIDDVPGATRFVAAAVRVMKKMPYW